MIFYVVTSTIFLFETLIALSNSIAALITNFKLKTSCKLPTLKAELKDAFNKQNKINPVDEFAKFARAQRNVNKLKSEVSSIIKETSYLQMQINYGLKMILYGLYVICSFLLLLLYRYHVCYSVPESWLYPFGRVLSFPLNQPGAISVPVWIGICRIVSKAMLG